MDKKVAFITGSSRGIGAAIAVEYARAGYDVAIAHHNSEADALAVQKQVEALGARSAVLRGDIGKLEDIDAMFDAFRRSFDRLDVMVNNAGITEFAPYLEATPELFERLVNTDFRGSFFCGQKAARMMIEQGVRGLIINITSNHQKGCWPIASVYASVKAALNKLTENMALELAAYGIRAVSIAPGYTVTRAFPKDPPPDFPADVWERILHTDRRIPLKRFCQPWEVGKACVFLSGEGAEYITGTCLYMDGGALLPVVPENTLSD